MGFEVIHNEDLAWTKLRQQHLVQKGQKDLAIGEAFDRHGGDQPLETQGPEHGEMPAPIDWLASQGPLAPRRTGVEAGHRLMAARFIEKDEVLRSEWLNGVLKRGPLPLDVGPLVLGGAKRFFYEAGPVWPMHG